MSQMLVVRPSPRTCVLLVALAVALLIVFWQMNGSPGKLMALPLYDFVEYWAAGRLNVHGENPYDPERMEQLERDAGRDLDAILMWNPPWTLPLVMPLGLLDCHTAHLLWLALQIAVLVWCADALWRLYGGPAARRGLAWLLAFTFVPTLIALTVGQIAPLVLLGAVLFLVYLKQGRDFRAGAALLLLAIKPHLSYLFWIALLGWCLGTRRWAILAGGLLAGVAALGAAAACNPAVLEQYVHTFTQHPPAQYRSPTLGTVLRLGLGQENFRLQFLALVPGIVWLAIYWRRHRRNWDWNERLPLLLLMSMLTAAYGAWPFDLVLLLVPLMQVAVFSFRFSVFGKNKPLLFSENRKPKTENCGLAAALVYLAINGVAALYLAHDGGEYFDFLWMTPVLLLAYLGLGRPNTFFPSRARSAAE